MVRVLMLALLSVMAASSTAAADEAAAPIPALTVDPVATDAAMRDYFAGETRGGYVLIGLGIGGLVSGGLLYRSSSRRATGASYPLLTVGLLHLAAGIYVSVASSNRVDEFEGAIKDDPAAFVRAERVRMKGVSTQFTVLKIVELTLIAGGLTAAGVGWRTDRPRLQGAGLALALEMALTLGFDLVAARRAHGYRDALATIDVQAGLDGDAGAPAILVIGHRGTF